MGNANNDHLRHQLCLLLFIFGSAALALVLYHIIKVTWYDRYQRSRLIRRPTFLSRRENTFESMENSVVGLIPAHKFQKGVGLVGEDALCAVCLSEFEEGEDLRMLPECLHSFHVQCIDMWFYSHSTCPICRSEVMSTSVSLSQCLSEDALGSGLPRLESGPRVHTQLSLVLQTI